MTKESTWEERFEKSFPFGTKFDNSNMGILQSFIRSEIERARKEGAEAAVEHIQERWAYWVKEGGSNEGFLIHLDGFLEEAKPPATLLLSELIPPIGL